MPKFEKLAERTDDGNLVALANAQDLSSLVLRHLAGDCDAQQAVRVSLRCNARRRPKS